MTDFHVECVRVGPIEKHPNADTLGITKVGDYPVIVKLGELATGDLAVYVPVDSVVPAKPEWAWLDGHRRIKAKRLRGIFSQGVLVKAPAGVTEGDDCAALLEIERYETPAERAENNTQTFLKSSADLPRYTDIENVRRWPTALTPGEPVFITEKLEGQNCRITYQRAPWWKRIFGVKGQAIVGSRTQIKTEGKWVEVTKNLARQLSRQGKFGERYAFYGESFGYTPGFAYGGKGPRFRLFDVWDRVEKRWLDYTEMVAVAGYYGLLTAPLLYAGEWRPEMCMLLAEGKSTLDETHVREGFVVRPEHERWQPGVGRVILKCKGEDYLLRKDG